MNFDKDRNEHPDLEDKIIKNQLKFDSLARKSFILSKLEVQTDAQEVEIIKRINRVRQHQQESQIIAEAQIHNPKFWTAFLRRHYDIAAWILMDFSANFFLYFFDTIKTRTQAKNRFRDISFFEKNDIKKLPIYRGVHYKLSYVVLSDILRSVTNQARYTVFQDPNSQFSKVNLFTKILLHGLMTEATITTMLLPIEIRKCLLQMGSDKMPISHYVKSYVHCFLPALMRDSVFFLTHSFTYNLLFYQDMYLRALMHPSEFQPSMINMVGDREKKFTCMMLSLTLSCLLTNPFEVMVSKMSTQRENIYKGPFQTLKTIYHEEGMGKLMSSAISSRMGFYFLKGLLFFTYQEKVMNLFSDAYND